MSLLTIPLIHRITRFATPAHHPEQAARYAYVNRLWKEAMIDYKGALYCWENEFKTRDARQLAMTMKQHHHEEVYWARKLERERTRGLRIQIRLGFEEHMRFKPLLVLQVGCRRNIPWILEAFLSSREKDFIEEHFKIFRRRKNGTRNEFHDGSSILFSLLKDYKKYPHLLKMFIQKIKDLLVLSIDSSKNDLAAVPHQETSEIAKTLGELILHQLQHGCGVGADSDDGHHLLSLLDEKRLPEEGYFMMCDFFVDIASTIKERIYPQTPSEVQEEWDERLAAAQAGKERPSEKFPTKEEKEKQALQMFLEIERRKQPILSFIASGKYSLYVIASGKYSLEFLEKVILKMREAGAFSTKVLEHSLQLAGTPVEIVRVLMKHLNEVEGTDAVNTQLKNVFGPKAFSQLSDSDFVALFELCVQYGIANDENFIDKDFMSRLIDRGGAKSCRMVYERLEKEGRLDSLMRELPKRNAKDFANSMTVGGISIYLKWLSDFGGEKELEEVMLQVDPDAGTILHPLVSRCLYYGRISHGQILATKLVISYFRDEETCQKWLRIPRTGGRRYDKKMERVIDDELVVSTRPWRDGYPLLFLRSKKCRERCDNEMRLQGLKW